MNLPITLTELGYGIGGIALGFITRDFFPWIFREALQQRKDRRVWYSELASLSNRANSNYNSNIGIPSVDDNIYYISRDSANELQEIESELSDLVNRPIDVEFEIEKEANALYDALSDLNDHLKIQSAESGEEGYVIPVGVDDSSFYSEINNVIDRVAERSLEVHDKATQKARSGTTIPILRVKV